MSQTIALIGKPNSGKSSLFNLLTGLNQKTGNYAGVTVDIKTGKCIGNVVIDLPGLNSLRITSPEETIAKQKILELSSAQTPFIFVSNGMQLEDNLILFSEIADLQTPLALVINFKDELSKNQISIQRQELEDIVGCPVVLVNSRNGDGLDELRLIIQKNRFKVPHAISRSLYDEFDDEVIKNSYFQKVQLSSDQNWNDNQTDYLKRQKTVSSIVRSTVNYLSENTYLQSTKKWDKILLHPIWGLAIFLFVMLVLFQAVFTFASYPMDLIDGGFAFLSGISEQYIQIAWLSDLVTNGIIPGLGGVLIFIPQIAILFFMLSVLEHTGYLSRISYISDGFLRKFGLSGKSIIPLMSSWACAIPAIMSTRVIDDPKERMAVIMASPLMTCSARLPVYTILIAVMFPEPSGSFINMQGISLLLLYLLGVIATLVVAWFITNRSNVEGNNLWTLELPVYRMPNWRNVFTTVYIKTKSFIVEAGKIIFFISILLWLLASFSPKSEDFIANKYEQYQQSDNIVELSKESFDLEYSYIGYMGKFIEPTIAPLGYDWKIGIALLTSFAAREVFVGTLSTIYSIGSEEESSIIEKLRTEINRNTSKPVFTMAVSVSLLLFYVFAMQCMSTMAIVRKETGSWKYAIVQFLFMLALAYGFAFIAYIILK